MALKTEEPVKDSTKKENLSLIILPEIFRVNSKRKIYQSFWGIHSPLELLIFGSRQKLFLREKSFLNLNLIFAQRIELYSLMNSLIKLFVSKLKRINKLLIYIHSKGIKISIVLFCFVYLFHLVNSVICFTTLFLLLIIKIL